MPPAKPQSTLLTVARLAGVSPSTVSRALRGHRLLNKETTARVRAVAERVGYHANPIISDLMRRVRSRGRLSNLGTIAYLTFHPTAFGWRDNATYRAFYEGAKQRAHELGFALEPIWASQPHLSAQRLTHILKARVVAGVVIGPRPTQPRADILDWAQFSVASVGVPLPAPRLHQAGSHHARCMERLLAALQTRGYRRAGLVLTRLQMSDTDHGWVATWALHQHASAARDRVPLLVLAPEGEGTFARWFERYEPDIVIGLDDDLPRWLARLGRRVPEDVGFARLSRPDRPDAPAGIDQKPMLIGGAAVDLVANQIFSSERGPAASPRSLLIEGEWVDGWSARPAAGS